MGIAFERGGFGERAMAGAVAGAAVLATGQLLTGSNAASGAGASMTSSSTTNFAAPDAAAPMAGTADLQTPDGQSPRSTPAVPSSGQLAGSFNYNNALSMVSSVMPNSATTSQTFDPSTGLLSSSVSVHGAITGYSYTFSPTVLTATTNNHWSKSYKDGFGRDLAVEAGYWSTIVSHTATVYGPCACSPLGKATYIYLPYAITGGQVVASDGTSFIDWNAYIYDGLGRTLNVMAPDGSRTQYLYLGNTVKVTDPAGNWKRYTNDALGNLVKVEEPNPAYGSSDSPSTNFVTTYTYDVEGHLTQVSMPRQGYTQTRTFNYNLATAQLTSATNPENGTVSYSYYPSARLMSKLDAKGQKVVYSYDGYGRLSYIDRYPDGVTWDPCQSMSLGYDSTATGTNRMGRVTSAATGAYWASYAGDTTPCGGSSVSEGYAYTPGGLTTVKSYLYSWPVYPVYPFYRACGPGDHIQLRQ